MHNPLCPDWRAHTRRLVTETLDDPAFFSLLTFVNHVRSTWDDERLAADPDAEAMFALLREDDAA